MISLRIIGRCPTDRSGRPRTRVRFVHTLGPALAVTLLAGAGGCGQTGTDEPLGVSSQVPTVPSPKPTSSLEATKQAIIDTYTGLWPAIKRAERVPAAQRRQVLSRHLEEPELGSLLQQIAEHEADGLRVYGQAVVHVTDVEVRGQKATLHDCRDSSQTGLIDEDTGEKVTVGVEEDHVIATLAQNRADEWRIKQVRHVEKSCSAAA